MDLRIANPFFNCHRGATLDPRNTSAACYFSVLMLARQFGLEYPDPRFGRKNHELTEAFKRHYSEAGFTMSEVIEAISIADANLPFLDIHGESWAQDPWMEARRVRESDPRSGRLARSSRGIEIFSYNDFTSASRDSRLDTLHTSRWAEQGAGPVTLDFVDNGHLLTFEPARHRQIRRLMVAAFPNSRIQASLGWFAELADGLIDGFIRDGHVELVSQFSHRYSIEILCRMIGVPQADIPIFEQATLDMALMNANPLQPGVERLESAMKTIWDYSVDIVRRRTAEPQEDFVSELISAHRTGGKISERETVWSVANLLFAGHDTTRYQLAATVSAVLQAGAWEDLATSPELVPKAVEEGIRLLPVVHLTSRVVNADDFVIDGVHMPRGTLLMFNWFAFNRDPERFVNPDQFDLYRDDFDARTPFGVGVHTCIGAALARADLEVALRGLTSRLTATHLDEVVPQHPFTGGMGGPTRLSLTFNPR